MFAFTVFLSGILSTTPIDSKPLQNLQATFAKKKGFEVEFEQEVKQQIFPDQKDLASGHVKFIRPSSLLWVYQTPTKRVIEYDGHRLKIAEGEQVEVVKDSGQINLQESFSFLWGQPNPKIFSIETKNATTFRVIPKDLKKAGFKFIDVTVGKGLVTEAVVRNHLDSESVLRFRGWKLQ